MRRLAPTDSPVAPLDARVEPDRALLADTLVDRRAPEQLLHGEPHPWNVLDALRTARRGRRWTTSPGSPGG